MSFSDYYPGKILGNLKPPHYVMLSFAFAIIVGTFLLRTPFTRVDGSILSFNDALFMATSATCVTGLSLFSIGDDFTLYGQIIILTLIQVGGLGIMTFSVLFLIFLRGKLSMTSRLVMMETLIDTQQVVNMKKLTVKIILYTLAFELVGTILFMIFLSPDKSNRFFNALFHSISGFCNAGFSLYHNSLERYAQDTGVLLTMSVLIITGGLGVVVVKDLFMINRVRSFRPWINTITMQTRVVLTATIFLLTLGTTLFFFTESRSTMQGESVGYRLQNAFFLSTTSRTAGFNTVPTGELSEPTKLFTISLMFIGASPGSTAGGIKTTTFIILIAMIMSVIRNRREVIIFKRRIVLEMVMRAATIFVFALLLVLAATAMLLVTESHLQESMIVQNPFLQFLFEATSAFGTVGLSTGITPYLSEPGKLIITLLMYIGRIGPLTMALIFAGFERPLKISHPEARVMIG